MPTRLLGLEALRTLVGQEVGVSDWFTVSQALIDAFSEVTQDRQWIHLDAPRAAVESPYGTTISHGFLTLSLLSHLHGQAVRVEGARRVINYGLNRVRFPAAVPAGAHVRSRSTLLALADIDGAVQLTWGVTIEVEGAAKPALAAEWLLRFYV
ncbi:MAG TPA: MaoC family dehydratase [Gemmataceae bacterium]|nr:MaoC family dehydratase [Gemmataceae bacterium]